MNQQGHPKGSRIDELSGGLEYLCSKSYGFGWQLHQERWLQRADEIRAADSYTDLPYVPSPIYHGNADVYTTREGSRLFVNDVGAKENLNFTIIGRINGSMSEPIHYFGGYSIPYSNDREIWRSIVDTTTYNNFCEIIVLPWGISYLRGSETDTPVALIDGFKKEALEKYRAYKEKLVVGEKLSKAINKEITKVLYKINEETYIAPVREAVSGVVEVIDQNPLENNSHVISRLSDAFNFSSDEEKRFQKGYDNLLEKFEK